MGLIGQIEHRTIGGFPKWLTWLTMFLQICCIFIYLQIIFNKMATLRTAFIETINPSKNPFYSIFSGLQAPLQQLSNGDDLKKQSKATKLIQNKRIFTRFSLYTMALSLKQAQFKILNRLLHENLNNFSELLDQKKNDFQNCQNFVHVLSLDTEEDETFRFSDIETVNSVSLRLEDTKNSGSIANTLQNYQEFNQSESDISIVEDIEVDL